MVKKWGYHIHFGLVNLIKTNRIFIGYLIKRRI